MIINMNIDPRNVVEEADMIYCKHPGNNCPRKESCKRYLQVEHFNRAPLYNVACTKDNNYVLYTKGDDTNPETS